MYLLYMVYSFMAVEELPLLKSNLTRIVFRTGWRVSLTRPENKAYQRRCCLGWIADKVYNTTNSYTFVQYLST